MPSDASATALRDMEHHVALADQFVAGLDYEAFRNDTRTAEVFLSWRREWQWVSG